MEVRRLALPKQLISCQPPGLSNFSILLLYFAPCQNGTHNSSTSVTAHATLGPHKHMGSGSTPSLRRGRTVDVVGATVTTKADTQRAPDALHAAGVLRRSRALISGEP